MSPLLTNRPTPVAVPVPWVTTVVGLVQAGAPVMCALNGTCALPAVAGASPTTPTVTSSDRPGGFGLADLYQSYRADIHSDFAWQTPTNLGATINTAANENGNGNFDNGGTVQLFRPRHAHRHLLKPMSDRIAHRPADRVGRTGDLHRRRRQPDRTRDRAARRLARYRGRQDHRTAYL